jgi:hypothetical protein
MTRHTMLHAHSENMLFSQYLGRRRDLTVQLTPLWWASSSATWHLELHERQVHAEVQQMELTQMSLLVPAILLLVI